MSATGQAGGAVAPAAADGSAAADGPTAPDAPVGAAAADGSAAPDEPAADRRPAVGGSPDDSARPPVVGMIGAGQLARMTAAAAAALGIGFRVLAETSADAAAQVCAGAVVGDFRDGDDLAAFATASDVVTFDHEHVPGRLLEPLERAGHVLRPAPRALRYTQDKLAMRTGLSGLGVPCPAFEPITDSGAVQRFAAEHGWPVVLKAISGGYDGRGVWVCDDAAQAADVLGHGIPLLVEEHVRFDRELAVLVARAPCGQGAAYPVVETVQRDGICREVIAPAPGLDADRAARAQALGLRIARDLGVTGLLAVELFETPDGLLANELAMRPHNTGHWTIEGSRTSQFEQHLRAILDLPLGDPRPVARFAVMANVLGAAVPPLRSGLPHVLAADPGIKVHLYGKQPRPGRKIGHVTALGQDLAEVRARARRAAGYLAGDLDD